MRASIWFILVGFIVIPCASVCGQGLQAEYFNNMTLSGDPVLTRVEAVNFDWGNGGPGDPIGTDQFSARWIGSITAPVSGEYVISTNTDDGVRVWLGPEQIISNWTDHAPTVNISRPVSLQEGVPVGIKIEWYENGGGAVMQLRWTGPGIAEQAIPAAVLSPTYTPAVKAWKPSPADGTIGVPAPLLEWTAGETATWHEVYLGTDPNLTEDDLVGPRQFHTLHYHLGLEPGARYYWRVDEIEKDGVTTHVGDVWTFVTQDVIAYYPDPEDGANDASTMPDLTWMAGQGAVGHQVYFSDDLDAVVQGTVAADQGTRELAEPNFAPGELQPLSTYYWRVDEIRASNEVKTGDIWTFTTCLPVDDFESYVDDWETGDAIWEIWLDGLTNNTGSYVGYPEAPFTEQEIVHGGLQSMPLDYNNIDAPFYSEAEREFASAQDWTVGDANALVLFVRGNLTNDVAPVYVALEDTSRNVHVVTHPDPALVTSLEWVKWEIPFSELTAAGVNVARIKKIYIGVGDRDEPQPDGAGRIYIDDVSLTKPGPVEEPDEAAAE